jgi:hypothetical protein
MHIWLLFISYHLASHIPPSGKWRWIWQHRNWKLR